MEFTPPAGINIDNVNLYDTGFSDVQCEDDVYNKREIIIPFISKFLDEEEIDNKEEQYTIVANENLDDKITEMLQKVSLESSRLSQIREKTEIKPVSNEFIEDEHLELIAITDNLEDEDNFIAFLYARDYTYPFVVLDHMLHYELDNKYHHYSEYPKELLESISKQVAIMIRICGLSQIEIEKLVVEHRYIVIHCILNSLFHDNNFNSEMIVLQFIIAILDNENIDEIDFTDHLMVKILFENVNFLKQKYFSVLIEHEGWIFLKDEIYELIESNPNLRDIVKTSKNDHLRMNF